MYLNAKFDLGRHHRAKIGYIILSNEETVEGDVFQLSPNGIGNHFNRFSASEEMSLEGVQNMRELIAEAAETILPGYDLDAVCFSCSAASMILGDKAICEILKHSRPDSYVCTVIGSSKLALNAVKAKKLDVLCPYPQQFESYVQEYLTSSGFEIVSYNSFEFATNQEINCLSPESILENAHNINSEESDTLFLCCGAMRSLEIVQELESSLGKPVICSNQAMMWDCLRKSGVNDKIDGFGRLLQLPGLDI